MNDLLLGGEKPEEDRFFNRSLIVVYGVWSRNVTFRQFTYASESGIKKHSSCSLRLGCSRVVVTRCQRRDTLRSRRPLLPTNSLLLRCRVSQLSQISANVHRQRNDCRPWRVPVLSPSTRNTVPSRIRFPPTNANKSPPLTVVSDSTERSLMRALRASCLRQTNLHASGPNHELPGRYPLGFVRIISRHTN